MNARTQIPRNAQNVFLTPARLGLLQRKCVRACSGTAGLDRETEDYRKKRLTLQRRAAGLSEPATVPTIVDELLRTPGQPMDPATRGFKKPRFGHDFSQIRVQAEAAINDADSGIQAASHKVREEGALAWHRADPENSVDDDSVDGSDLVPASAGKVPTGERIRFPAMIDIAQSPKVETERATDWNEGLKDLKERGAWIMWQGSPNDPSTGTRDDSRGSYSVIRWPVPGGNDAVSNGPFPSEDSLNFCVGHYHQHPPLTPDLESMRDDFPVGPSQSDIDNANDLDSPGIVRDFTDINRTTVKDYLYGPTRR